MRDDGTAVRWSAIAACLILTGCTNGSEPAAGSAVATTTHDEPASTRSGPGTAQFGVPYPFELYTHCGVEFAGFDGRTWKVVEAVPDPAGTPFARGAVNQLSGTVVLVEEDVLRFTVAAESNVIPGEVVTFRPTSEVPRPCV